MDRIDFLGAPGVGKTSIYKELLRQRTKKDNWLTCDEAKVKIAKWYLLRDKKYLKYVLLKINLLKNINFFVADRILEKYYIEFLWNKKNDNNLFLDIAIKGMFAEEKDSTRKLIGINWFFKVFKEVFLLENCKIPGLFLSDESLSQKAYGLISDNQELSKNLIKDYFNIMPLPSILIYYYTDPNILLNRVKGRKKRILNHRGLNDDKLKKVILNYMNILLIAKDILKKRGVPIINIDTNDNIEISSKKILNLIRQNYWKK